MSGLHIMAIRARWHRACGVPALHVPWGTPQRWRAAEDLPRDIDVLWLGKPRTRRRAHALARLHRGLAQHGVRMVVADGVERPLVYGRERATLLSRAKMTLNVLPTWHDNNFVFRFHLAAPYGSLVVSDRSCLIRATTRPANIMCVRRWMQWRRLSCVY